MQALIVDIGILRIIRRPVEGAYTVASDFYLIVPIVLVDSVAEVVFEGQAVLETGQYVAEMVVLEQDLREDSPHLPNQYI